METQSLPSTPSKRSYRDKDQLPSREKKMKVRGRKSAWLQDKAMVDLNTWKRRWRAGREARKPLGIASTTASTSAGKVRGTVSVPVTQSTTSSNQVKKLPSQGVLVSAGLPMSRRRRRSRRCWWSRRLELPSSRATPRRDPRISSGSSIWPGLRALWCCSSGGTNRLQVCVLLRAFCRIFW